MNQGSGACLWTPVPQHCPAPCDRYKHASCAHKGHVYLLGGREKCSLRDFWKYNVVCNEWAELPCNSEEAPEELEEHTMVAHQEFLYVFGGMQDSSYTNSKIPLWVFDIVKECWINWKTGSETLQGVTPANRKGHSAVTFGSSMYVYGGYIDIRGSTKEFWKFDFDSRMWSLLSSAQGGPGPRHGHSAMTFQDCMYLFGGLQGLREQKDLWSWSSASQTWSCIKFHSGPSRLVGHSAVLFKDSMLIFGGGETQSSPQNSLWRFSLKTQTWKKLALLPGSASLCRIHHCSIGMGQSFQPTAPNGIFFREIPNSYNINNKLRPFKNKCQPSRSTMQEPCIELQTFHMDNKKCLPDLSTALKDTKLKGSCLTFENQEALREKQSSGDLTEENEDAMFLHMPDLLLVLGGKPLQGQHMISVWHMTVA
ncbi:actin-fragmin kinase isoform X1 [Megalobrama amblycephala]|uniref:actin-fragmin kinase isoform X1 n=2 Tax=Megalobrama amblycephala TaxID=75352 RepID=UPI0020147015|nr:actin-fragmin kinase isoform X1 [Megalobrama amblycephala]XP_048049466.1 actin-fragmin kinase isoform X1 [Megalobrama amblycephala]